MVPAKEAAGVWTGKKCSGNIARSWVCAYLQYRVAALTLSFWSFLSSCLARACSETRCCSFFPVSGEVRLDWTGLREGWDGVVDSPRIVQYEVCWEHCVARMSRSKALTTALHAQPAGSQIRKSRRDTDIMLAPSSSHSHPESQPADGKYKDLQRVHTPERSELYGLLQSDS